MISWTEFLDRAAQLKAMDSTKGGRVSGRQRDEDQVRESELV